MSGGHDPRELQKRSVEARRRRKPDDLERAYLDIVRDPQAPSYVRMRAAAKLERLRENPRELASADPYSRLEPGEPRGALLGQMMGTPPPPLNDEAPGRTSGIPPSQPLSSEGDPSPPEISSSSFDPMKRQREMTALQNLKEREIPDPSLLRPHEQYDFGWDNSP